MVNNKKPLSGKKRFCFKDGLLACYEKKLKHCVSSLHSVACIAVYFPKISNAERVFTYGFDVCVSS